MNPNLFVRFEDISCDKNKYKYVDVDAGFTPILYNLIILPKEKIESIKYLNIEFDFEYGITGFEDLFK